MSESASRRPPRERRRRRLSCDADSIKAAPPYRGELLLLVILVFPVSSSNAQIHDFSQSGPAAETVTGIVLQQKHNHQQQQQGENLSTQLPSPNFALQKWSGGQSSQQFLVQELQHSRPQLLIQQLNPHAHPQLNLATEWPSRWQQSLQEQQTNGQRVPPDQPSNASPDRRAAAQGAWQPQPEGVAEAPPPRRRPAAKCVDRDMNCYVWVAKEPEKCLSDENMIKFCKRTCQLCENGTVLEIPEAYDVRRAPSNLHRVAFLIGRWKSDFGGKADFPTIPRFTYGEKLDFSLALLGHKTPVLNYTAFAWDNSDLTELHSENGFLAGKPNSSWVALNTVMSNGFLTVEEGNERQHSVRLGLRRIGRLNFSRDLPVRRMIREWVLLNETHLEQRLLMATSTHPMLLHTNIIYKKVFP